MDGFEEWSSQRPLWWSGRCQRSCRVRSGPCRPLHGRTLGAFGRVRLRRGSCGRSEALNLGVVAAHAVALAVDVDDDGAVQEAVQHRSGDDGIVVAPA